MAHMSQDICHGLVNVNMSSWGNDMKVDAAVALIYTVPHTDIALP